MNIFKALKGISMRFILLSFLCVTLFYAQTAMAETVIISEKGQEALKTLILKHLHHQQEIYKQAGGNLAIDGDINIERADTYYSVTLPKIVVTSPMGERGEIGMIAMNATPDAIPGSWKISAALPTPINYFDKGNKPITRVDIGTQNISGVWNDRLTQFTKLNGDFKDIKISHFSSQSVTLIPSFLVTADLNETVKDKWSGTVFGMGKNIKTHTADGLAGSDIGVAKITMDVKNLMPETPAAAKITETTTEKPSYTLGLSSEGLKTTFLLENTSFFFPDLTTTKKTTQKISVASFGFSLDIADADKPNMSGKIQTSWKNLSAKPETPLFTAFMPRTFNMDISADKLPLQRLINFGSELSPTSNGASHIFALLSLPQIFSESGTTLNIKDTYLTNGVYRGFIQGQVKASTASAIGAEGYITAQLDGINALQETLKTQKETASPAQQSVIDDINGRLSIINALGKDGKGTDGSPVRAYEFVISKEGNITLNGSDISTLMLMAAPKAGTPKARSDVAAPPPSPVNGSVTKP